MIVKVQVSQFTNAPKPQVLAYNEDRSIMWEGDLPKALKQKMGKSPKKFFHAEIDDSQKIIIGEEAEWQDW